MGDYCRRFRRTQEFTTVGEPEVGDELSTRTSDEGVKALMCSRKGIITCLAPGDRVKLSNFRPKFRRAWKLGGAQSKEAGFDQRNGKDCFVIDGITVIPIAQLNRKLNMTVLSVAERWPNEIEVREDELPAPHTVAQVSRTCEAVAMTV